MISLLHRRKLDESQKPIFDHAIIRDRRIVGETCRRMLIRFTNTHHDRNNGPFYPGKDEVKSVKDEENEQ